MILTSYNGLQVLDDSTTPVPGDGGRAINDNFKALSTYQATTDPTASNDHTQGFRAGSRWFNTSTDTEWICTDDGASSGPSGATWDRLTPGTQWVTSGTKIYYAAGNVGIGTTNPGYGLDVETGSIKVNNGISGAGSSGTIYLGDGSFTKSYGAAWDIHGGLQLTGSLKVSNGIIGPGNSGSIYLGDGVLTKSYGAQWEFSGGLQITGGLKLDFVAQGTLQIYSDQADSSTDIYTLRSSGSTGAGNDGSKLYISGGSPGSGASYGAVVLAPNGGRVGVGATSPTAALDLVASTAAAASLRLRAGTAPTSPNDGDLWYDGTDLKFRVGGVTKTVTLT